MAQWNPESEKLHSNDLVCQFNETGTIYCGKVIPSPENAQLITWQHGDRALVTESVSDAAKRGKLFIVNREVYVGSLASIQGRVGHVTDTQHNVIGLIQKRITGPGCLQETFVIPKLHVDRLKKVIPFKVGDYVLYNEWIGTVTAVLIKTKWNFDSYDHVWVTLPVEVYAEKNFRLGTVVTNFPDEFSTFDCKFKIKSWLSCMTKKQHKKSATLSDIEMESVEVCWLHNNVATSQDPNSEPPTKISDQKELEMMNAYHFPTNDWSYFDKNECFQLTLIADDLDNLISYSEWQTKTLLVCSELVSGHCFASEKKMKKNPQFQSGEVVFLYPFAMQTDTVIVTNVGGREVKNYAAADQICEVSNSTLPRIHFTNPLKSIRYGDMVQDKCDYSAIKYGFIINETPRDGYILVKWITELGEKGVEETVSWVSWFDLTPHPFQSEFSIEKQHKVVTTENGLNGTLKGLIFPNCEAVIRKAGSFKDMLVWPHEVRFLAKTAVPIAEDADNKWEVIEIIPNRPHFCRWLSTLFKFNQDSVILAPQDSPIAGIRSAYLKHTGADEGLALRQHTFLQTGSHEKQLEGLNIPLENFISSKIMGLNAKDLENVLRIERFASRPELLTCYVMGEPKTGLEAILFVVDVWFPRLFGFAVNTCPVQIGFRCVGQLKVNWPTTRVDKDGRFLECGQSNEELSRLLQYIRETIHTMDPVSERPVVGTASSTIRVWEEAYLCIIDYLVASLCHCPSISQKQLIGDHYYNNLMGILTKCMEFMPSSSDGTISAFQTSFARRIRKIYEFIDASPEHKIARLKDANGNYCYVRS